MAPPSVRPGIEQITSRVASPTWLQASPSREPARRSSSRSTPRHLLFQHGGKTSSLEIWIYIGPLLILTSRREEFSRSFHQPVITVEVLNKILASQEYRKCIYSCRREGTNIRFKLNVQVPSISSCAEGNAKERLGD